ncbi:MAG: hypothetical protein PF569_07655 [Candidatus Woesearchaeota archaeon]|jgi:hypothetical protein|nr:hypothetical protein [Candidatus Woesearchaeota archaeon]
MNNTKILMIFLLIGSLLFTGCIPRMDELELNTDPRLYAGEGEMCENQYMKVECSEGLECIPKSTKPYVIGFCYLPGYVYNEDFINRNTYEGNPDYDTRINLSS